jgi:protein polybromo-1
LCQQLYDVLRNQKKEDGTLLCDAFIRVPKRRQEPGYYEVVSNPIDLLKVQQKLKTDEYRDMDDLAADIQLMVNNAKAFYMVRCTYYLLSRLYLVQSFICINDEISVNCYSLY